MIKFLVEHCKKAILLPTLKLGYKNTKLSPFQDQKCHQILVSFEIGLTGRLVKGLEFNFACCISKNTDRKVLKISNIVKTASQSN